MSIEAYVESYTRGPDSFMDQLLDGACGVDLGFGWRHFTIIACCNEWIITAKKSGNQWFIRDMRCIPST